MRAVARSRLQPDHQGTAGVLIPPLNLDGFEAEFTTRRAAQVNDTTGKKKKAQTLWLWCETASDGWPHPAEDVLLTVQRLHSSNQTEREKEREHGAQE